MKNKSLGDIAKDVKSGKYFEDAIEWHCEKYLKVWQERNIFFVIFIVLIICAAMLFGQIKAWFPLKIGRPVVIETSVDSDHYLTMNKMSTRYKNPDYAVLSYLLRNYVRLMEEYKKGDLNPLKIDSRIRKVANNTTKEISDNFANIFYQTSIENPLYRFGNSGRRRVDFKQINLTGIDESFANQIKSFGRKAFKLPTDATVFFNTEERNFLGEVKVQRWRAKIDFIFSGVILQEDKNRKEISIPQFVITNYNVVELKK